MDEDDGRRGAAGGSGVGHDWSFLKDSLDKRLCLPRAERGTAGNRCAAPWLQLAQRSKGGTDLFGEELWLLPRGKVPAPLGLVEVDEVGIPQLHPAPRRPEDLAGERGEANRQRNLRRSLAGRTRFRLSLSELPVPPGSRGAGAGKPVQRDVVDDAVPGQPTRGLV